MNGEHAPEEAGDLTAVVAHSLLAPVWACEAAAKTLLQHHEQLSVQARNDLLDLIAARANFTSEMLVDLVRGGSQAVIDALDGLRTGF